MTPYFSKFPQMVYDIDDTGTQARAVVDIFHRAKFLEVVKQNLVVFYDYRVKEGETPEIIADKLYGSSQYHWVVLLTNDIFSLWDDWPLSYQQYVAFLTKKYGSVETASTTIDHYQDQYGATIDYTTYLATISDGSIIVYADQQELIINDAKRDIQLIDVGFVAQIETALNALLIPKS